MKISSPSEDRIIVDLSAQDMAELEITYEEMDYSTIETRRVIWTLLDAAGKKLHRNIDPSGKMVIEAMPRQSGGCTLVFTVLEGHYCDRDKKSVLRKQPETLACEFGSLDDLYRCALSLRSDASICESSLFADSGRYLLLLSSPFDINGIRNKLNEFGKCEICEILRADFIREHWKILASGNAVKKLTAAGSCGQQAP
ncbi:MAG: adaptor protein MecA [Clostridia bacterium]|nr:adaptor protein MecA [Clostridia bacterium]